MEYGMKAAIIEDEKTHRDLLSSYIEAWGKKTKDPVFIKEYENAASYYNIFMVNIPYSQ